MSDHAAIFPDQAASGPFDLERLVVSGGTLSIELAKLGQREVVVEFNFEFHLAMRRTSESDARLIFEEIRVAAGLGRSFYEARSSRFLDWFSGESAQTMAGPDLRNYCFLCEDDVIDGIALAPPTVRVLDRRQR